MHDTTPDDAHGTSSDTPHTHREEWLEIFEAAVLAAVAVLTAWSGYQASRWDARSAEGYSRAAGTTVRAQEQQTLAGQDRLYDITTFNAWLRARLRGETALAVYLEDRFRPEYAVAFAAWMATDPFHDPKAPAGPIFMPEYRSARADASRRLGAESASLFQAAVAARSTGDEYVRITVVLATVLFLTALSQRFRVRKIRAALLVFGFLMLCLALFWIATFPRA